MRREAIVASVLLSACGGPSSSSEQSASTATPPPTMAVQVEGDPTPAATANVEERAVAVTWSEASATSGCFFFSGPPVAGVEVRQVHGTRATLRRELDTLSLDFGDGVVFRGPTSTARLVREESYDYQGKWGITETIAFDVVGDGAWHGSYDYEECEMDSGATCPGTCRIDAKIAIE
jgi:hypothetical protein